MKKKDEQIALFRYQVIAPVIYGKEQTRYFREMEKQYFEVPFIGRKKYKTATFKNWLYAYRRYGIDGLKPKVRNDLGEFKSISDELRTIIIDVINDYHIVSGAQLYRILLSGNHISHNDFSYQTLSKYIKTNKLLEKTEKVARKRYEKAHINQLWLTDFMRGKSINSKRTYLCCIIDDHSRLITGYGWFLTESGISFEKTLKQAILRYGIPEVVYADNGSSFINGDIHLSCARLGIALIHTKPYQPASKGKIERFFRTVRAQFMPNTPFEDIEEVNILFKNWLEKEYHQSVHSSTKETPIDRYINDMEQTEVKNINENELNNLFYRTLKRKVKKDCTVSIKNNAYETPTKYIGEEIEIRYPSESPEELYIYENEKAVSRLSKVDLNHNANFGKVSIFTVMEDKNV